MNGSLIPQASPDLKSKAAILGLGRPGDEARRMTSPTSKVSGYWSACNEEVVFLVLVG